MKSKLGSYIPSNQISSMDGMRKAGSSTALDDIKSQYFQLFHDFINGGGSPETDLPQQQNSIENVRLLTNRLSVKDREGFDFAECLHCITSTSSKWSFRELFQLVLGLQYRVSSSER